MGQKDLFPEFSFTDEFSGVRFGDKRLDARFSKVVETFASLPSAPINKACADWAETKSAYRLLNNDKIDVEEILDCHRKQTVQRMRGFNLVVVVQDTTHLNYQSHSKTKDLGSIGYNPGSKKHTSGLIVHTSLAMTSSGVPLGLVDQHIWSRGASGEGEVADHETRKWLRGLKATVEMQSQLEGVKTITVADREADITELVIYANRFNAGFVLRAKNFRALEGQGKQNLYGFLSAQCVQHSYELEVIERLPPLLGSVTRKKKRVSPQRRLASLEVRFAKIQLKHARVSLDIRANCDEELSCWAVLVSEKDPPSKQKPIEWILLTNLAVNTSAQAQEVIELYQLRWGIENFHKVMKSGCQVEDCRLSTAKRLKRYITIKSIIAWRLYLLTRAQRQDPGKPCTLVLRETEWKALYTKIHKSTNFPEKPPTLEEATIWIARLGGYLDRNNDPPPGVIVMSRGWERLYEITEMYEVIKTCG